MLNFQGAGGKGQGARENLFCFYVISFLFSALIFYSLAPCSSLLAPFRD